MIHESMTPIPFVPLALTLTLTPTPTNVVGYIESECAPGRLLLIAS